MKSLLLLLLSATLVHAQTTAADQSAAAFKAAKTKLDVKNEAEMAKKAGDKEKTKKEYRKAVQDLETRYLPVMFTETGTAQKAGDAAKEEALKKTLDESFKTKIGEVLMGGKLLDVSSAGLTKIGSAVEGDRIQLQYICGTWNVYPTSPMVNPDETGTKECNIKLLHKAISGEETVIESNIKHTRDKPYTHDVEIRGTYFLMISGTVHNAHSGSTVYRVVVAKK
ncbi:hypothetical protein [Luteolibacter soli]|uniref:Uncharacterized protein n=1 Tax=Luteolibacter soli TaxID=3135280 RepID=A0ABU9AXP8_9BACT